MICDYLLHGATEGEFFREGGQEGHETDVDEQAAEVIGLQEAFGKNRCRFFHGAELLLECSERSGEDDTVVQVRQKVDRGNGTKHDAYRNEAEETVRTGIQAEPGEGLVIIAPYVSTEDRRQEESSNRLGELKPFERGGGLPISD